MRTELLVKPTFQTPFEQFKEHNGKTFVIIRKLDDTECDVHEVGDMYKIKLETGEIIDAWPEEILI